MIRLFSILTFCLLVQTTLAQQKKFFEAIPWSPLIKYDQATPTDSRISVRDFNAPGVCGNFIEYLNAKLKRKLREPLVQDSLLNKICNAGLESWNENRYTDYYKWKAERPWIDKAIRENGAVHKMFVAYATKVDLVDYSPVLNYHYDKKRGTSEIDLYAGSKRGKKNDSTDEEEADDGPTPIELKTEAQLCKFIYDKLNQKGFNRYVFGKSFTQIGLAVKLDERTLNNKKRPQLYIMIVIAGKQNQKVRERYNPLAEDAENIKSGKIVLKDQE